MSPICFCFVPRGGNLFPRSIQSMPPNCFCVGYLFARCFSRCQWMSLDGGLNPKIDDQRHLRGTLLFLDLFLLLPLLQLLGLPSASLLASRFRPQNLILEVSARALLEPSSIQHVLQTMPCSCSLLLDRISMALLESLAEHGVVKRYVNQHCFCCEQQASGGSYVSACRYSRGIR